MSIENDKENGKPTPCVCLELRITKLIMILLQYKNSRTLILFEIYEK